MGTSSRAKLSHKERRKILKKKRNVAKNICISLKFYLQFHHKSLFKIIHIYVLKISLDVFISSHSLQFVLILHNQILTSISKGHSPPPIPILFYYRAYSLSVSSYLRTNSQTSIFVSPDQKMMTKILNPCQDNSFTCLI